MEADCEVKTKKNQGWLSEWKENSSGMIDNEVCLLKKKHKCWYNKLIRISWKSLQIKNGQEKVALYYL